jgi:ABC-type phosphate transport system substrate-binding protein
VSSSWVGPGTGNDPNQNFIGEPGAVGILAAVQATPYSTGYLEGSYARTADPRVGQAWLQNGFAKKKAIFVNPEDKSAVIRAFNRITAADINYGEGSDEEPLGTSAPWCVLYIDPKYFVSPPAHAYPIAAVSYLLFYGQNNGVHTADKIALIKFLESKQANNMVSKFEYTALSSTIETASLNALNGNGGSQPACVQ